jgi:hypothetical protein
MVPALSSDDRSMDLHNKFQQVHGRMNYLLYLLFGPQASPRRFSYKSGVLQMLIQSRADLEVPEHHQGYF